jgi:uncharacterized protein (DUF2164 family)
MQKIVLSKDVKPKVLEDIKRYFSEERDEDIGDLAAGLLLDYITENIGPYYYNQAIKDACRFMGEKVEDMYGLEKSPRT